MEHVTRADVSCTGAVVVCTCGYRSWHPDRDRARADRARHETLYAAAAASPAAAAVRQARHRARQAG